jgi:hypothetical protein
MIRIVDQHQVGEPIRVARQVHEGVITPDVAVDHQEGLGTEQRQRLQDATTGLQRPLGLDRVADRHAVLAAIAEHGLDLVAEVGVVDDEVTDTRRGQRFEVVDDQRAAGDRQQRLRRGVGQRPHALAAAGGQDHRPHRLAASAARSSDGSPFSMSCSAASSG